MMIVEPFRHLVELVVCEMGVLHSGIPEDQKLPWIIIAHVFTYTSLLEEQEWAFCGNPGDEQKGAGL